MRVRGRGHPAIRATHAKTLELITGDELSERGTCVIATAAVGELWAPLAGPIRVTLRAGDEHFTFTARANSGWNPAADTSIGMVFRRGPLRLPNTFATHADAAAIDLPRSLVAALADPRAVVEIDIEPLTETATCVVLMQLPVPRATLAAELAAADGVVVQDSTARRLLGDHPHASASRDGDRRILVAAAEAMPSSTGAADRIGTDGRIETVGMPAQLAAAAALPGAPPLTVAGAGSGAGADLLRSTPATHALVVGVPRSEIPKLLVQARETRGTRRVVLARTDADPVRLDVDATPPDELLAGATTVWCALEPVPDALLDPAARAAATGLLAAGVSTRTAADALAQFTGWPRGRAYRAVLDLGAASPDDR